MDFYGFTFIMFIGAAGALLGFIILLFTAFTTSAAWGIGSLVVPPVVIAFAVSHWSKAKNGLAILMIGVIIFAYGTWDRNQMSASQATEPSVEESTPAEPVPAPAPAPSPPAETQSSESPPVPPATVPAPQEATAGSDKPVVINIIDAHKYINREVRVTTDSGKVRTGTLLEVHNSGIVMDFVVKGATGRVRAEIAEDKIHLIELLP